MKNLQIAAVVTVIRMAQSVLGWLLALGRCFQAMLENETERNCFDPGAWSALLF